MSRIDEWQWPKRRIMIKVKLETIRKVFKKCFQKLKCFLQRGS